MPEESEYLSPGVYAKIEWEKRLSVQKEDVTCVKFSGAFSLYGWKDKLQGIYYFYQSPTHEFFLLPDLTVQQVEGKECDVRKIEDFFPL